MKTRVADRIVVVTTSSIIKLDNKYKVMKTIPLEKVSANKGEGAGIVWLLHCSRKSCRGRSGWGIKVMLRF